MEQLLSEAERLRRYTALVERTSGADELHVWDPVCLTRPLDARQARSATLAMYMRPGEIGEPEFVFFNHGTKVDLLAFAVAIGTLHVEQAQWDAMQTRDREMSAYDHFAGDARDDNYRSGVFQYVADHLPQQDGVPLPVAYVGLETPIDGMRRHLGLWCFSQVPMVAVWEVFHTRVIGGVLGL